MLHSPRLSCSAGPASGQGLGSPQMHASLNTMPNNERLLSLHQAGTLPVHSMSPPPLCPELLAIVFVMKPSVETDRINREIVAAQSGPSNR